MLASSSPLLEAFRQGLRELEYLEGRNILIEHRSPEGRDERLPELAAELVRLNVDVIVASSQAAVAARKVTATIPIVMPIITDPVRLGLVASVAKPGRNATGFATQNDELPGKWLELVKETHAEDRAAEAFANPEARDHYARALDAAAKLVAPPSNDVIARMRSKLGGVLQVLGDYEAAAASYNAGLELVRGTHDRAGEIDMLLGLSMTYNLYHRGEEAFGYADQALVVSRESNDVARQAASLGHKVMARAAGYGQIVEATPEAEEAVRLSENIGDPGLLAQTLIFAGQLSERTRFIVSLRLSCWRRGPGDAERRALEDWVRLRFQLAASAPMMAIIGAVGRLSDAGMTADGAIGTVLRILDECYRAPRLPDNGGDAHDVIGQTNVMLSCVTSC